MLKSLDGVLQRVPGCKSHREWALSVHLQDETFETHPAGKKQTVHLCTLGEEDRWWSQKADKP